MARDRQRGKQRRARQSADSGPAARPDGDEPLALGDDSAPSGNQGVEDVLDERGPEGTTPAPDPLKHASAYVDEAKLTEAGADVEPPHDGGDERAEDRLGYSSGPVEGSAPEQVAGAEPADRRRGRTMSFLRQSAEELKRVQWPDRRQTGQGTAVTLGFVVLAGAFLGLMDAIWKPIIEAII